MEIRHEPEKNRGNMSRNHRKIREICRESEKIRMSKTEEKFEKYQNFTQVGPPLNKILDPPMGSYNREVLCSCTYDKDYTNF